MKLKSLVRNECEFNVVALDTEPILTKEVFDEARSRFSSQLTVSFGDGVIKVKGFPPLATKELFEHIEKELAGAYETILNNRKNEKSAQDSIVGRFSQVSGLPIS